MICSAEILIFFYLVSTESIFFLLKLSFSIAIFSLFYSVIFSRRLFQTKRAFITRKFLSIKYFRAAVIFQAYSTLSVLRKLFLLRITSRNSENLVAFHNLFCLVPDGLQNNSVCF